MTHPGTKFQAAPPLQMPLAFQLPATTWAAPLMTALPRWGEARRVAIDVETRDDRISQDLGIGSRHGGYVCGYAVAIEDGPAFYLPVRHEGGGNLDPRGVRDYVRDQAKQFKGAVVGAKLGYDLDYLHYEVVKFHHDARFLDVQVAEPLIYDLHFSYSLESIAQRWGLLGKDETLLQQAARAFGVHPKGGLWRLEPKYVGAYAEQDVRLPLAVMRRQERKLEEDDLLRVWDVECRLLPVLVKMRRRGVRVDVAKVERIEAMARRIEAECAEIVRHHTGVTIPPDGFTKPSILAPALRAMGIKPPDNVRVSKLGKVTKTPSITKDLLAEIDHPVTNAIRRAREFVKLRNTYCKAIHDHAICHGPDDWRVHPTINQCKVQKREGYGRDEDTEGAGPGRTSCVDPSIQNQPTRSDQLIPWPGEVAVVELSGGKKETHADHVTLGVLWRSVYLPDKGKRWRCVDISQQEPRAIVDYAARMGLRGAREVAEMYRANPKMDSYEILMRVSTMPRKLCKEVFLARCYQMGGARYCRKMNLPTVERLDEREGRVREYAGEEGQRQLDDFDGALPFVKQLSKIATRRAEERGYIVTYLGRRCYFRETSPGSGVYEDAYKAGNRIAQGFGAEQTKKGMVDADAAGVEMQLTVHDEVDLSEEDGSIQASRAARDAFRDAIALTIPVRVDVEDGTDWGHLEKIDVDRGMSHAG